ncbi:phage head spike fiber domain-containing protein [Pseudoroseomonas ludipueritiae]
MDSPPVAMSDVAAVTKGTVLVATGNVLENDSDPEGGPLTVSAVNGQAGRVGTTLAGTYGTLRLGADGQYTYTLASGQANVQALGAGQVVTETFHYTLSDGQPHLVQRPGPWQNLLSFSEALDNTAWSRFSVPGTLPAVAANVAADPFGNTTTADRLTLSGTASGLFQNVAVSGQHTFSVWMRLVSGDGHFSFNYYDGGSNNLQAGLATGEWQRFTWTFTGNGAAGGNVALMHDFTQAATGVFEVWGAQLNAGTTAQDYLATTSTPLTIANPQPTELLVSSTLTISIQGATDSPPVAVSDVAAVTKGTVLVATGNVLENDSDPEGGPLTVSAVNGQAGRVGTTLAGTYGTLRLGADGQYTYTLASGQANVQALGAGQVVTETFHYTLSDGQPHLVQRPGPWQNLLSFSEALDNTAWSRFSVPGTLPAVAANVAADPFGNTTTADRLTLSGTASGLFQNVAVSGQHTFSVWMRLVSGDGHFSFNYYDGGSNNLQAGLATGEWQRFTWTFTGNGAAGGNVALMHDFTQAATGVFEVWGAQLNAGTTAQDYLATTSTPLTIANPQPTELLVSSTLTISIQGADDPGMLNLDSASRGVVADLTAREWSHPMAIVPFGDSVTYGWGPQDDLGNRGDSDGYRNPLWWDFAAQHMLVDFIGPDDSGTVRLPNPNHAGYPGARADQLLPHVDEVMQMLSDVTASGAPAAVLLLAGLNDITQEVSPEVTIGQEMRNILDAIAQADPLVHVYVATLTPITEQHANPNKVFEVNEAITLTVAQAIAAGLNVSLVSMDNITLADLYDGKHPDDIGYAKMARNWHDAILATQPAQGGTPGGDAQPIGSAVRDVVGSAFNDLLIGDSGPNLLSGGDGNDRLLGGGGTDTLVGGSGYDQFAFEPKAGAVTVADFSAAESDALVFLNFTGLTGFASIAAQVSHQGSDTVIDLHRLGFDLKITLAGFTGTLGDSNVWFA